MEREKTFGKAEDADYMAQWGRLAIVVAISFCALGVANGQDLAPRAYVITPVHWNALTLTYTYDSGSLQFDGAAPITGATANISTPVVTYYHALNFFGRSANVLASLPYSVGNLQGMVQGAEGHLYRPVLRTRYTVFP